MKEADLQLHAWTSEQKPLADLSKEGKDSSGQVTHKSIKYFA
jgi:hypothetical protein